MSFICLNDTTLYHLRIEPIIQDPTVRTESWLTLILSRAKLESSQEKSEDYRSKFSFDVIEQSIAILPAGRRSYKDPGVHVLFVRPQCRIT